MIKIQKNELENITQSTETASIKRWGENCQKDLLTHRKLLRQPGDKQTQQICPAKIKLNENLGYLAGWLG